MQYDIKPIFLSLMPPIQLHASLPLLSLGKDAARLNPKLNTSPIARTTNLVGQTKSKRLATISNHAYKNLEKIQIIFIDKLIVNPQFIGSRQTHRKRILHRIELQEHRGEHCIENQKRERKPSSYCLWTRRSMMNYSQIIREAPMRIMNPSVIVFPSGRVPE